MTSHHIEAEQRLLGVLLMDGSKYWQTTVKPGDFSQRNHQVIFEQIQHHAKSSKPIDTISIAEALEGRRGENVGLAYLGELSQIPYTVQLESCESIIKDHANRQRIQSAAQEAISMLGDGRDPLEVSEFLSQNTNVETETTDTSWTAALTDSLECAQEAAHSDQVVRGCTSTIPRLDKLTRGFRGGQVITIGGRPGTLKSAYATQVAKANAKLGTSVGIISLEMTARELADRIIASECNVNGQSFSAGDKAAVELVKQRMTPEIEQLPIRIDDKAMTVQEIRSRVNEWVRRHKVGLIIVDYLQLVRSNTGNKNDNRSTQVGAISRELKLMAMRHQVPILLLSQLNRQCEIEKRPPRMSDLRESGDIEQDSDVVLFTHAYNAGDSQAYNLILAKQRSGPKGEMIRLSVEGASYTIKEAELSGL